MDEGMAALVGGRWYHGADCLNVLALASSRSGAANRIAGAVFSSPRRARLLYPALRAGRNATLALLGRSKIHAASEESSVGDSRKQSKPTNG